MGLMRQPRALSFAVLLAALASISSPAAGKAGRDAPWIPPVLGPYLNIWTDASENANMSVAYNGVHDEYLAVWTIKQDDWTTDLWGRRIGGDGTLSPYFCIATAPGKKIVAAAVAYSSKQDRYFVVFEYPRAANVTDTDLSAVSFAHDGTNLSGWLDVHPSEDVLAHPGVAYNERDDEFLVVYEDTPSCTRISARRFDARTGSPKDVPRTINDCATGQFGTWNRGPDVAYNPSRNNYLVSYINIQSQSPNPYRSYMHGRIASSTLSAISPAFQFSGDGISSAYGHVACGKDEYLAVWTATGNRVYARRVNPDGTLPVPGDGFLVSLATSSNLGNGVGATDQGYWVAWDSGDYSKADVYGNFVPMGADRAASVEFPIDADIGSQQASRIACRGGGGCLVTDSYNLEYPAGDAEIRGRLLRPVRFLLPLTIR